MATFALKIKSNQVFIKQRSGQAAVRLILKHRLTGTTFDLEQLNAREWHLDPTKIVWEPTYWDVYAYFSADDSQLERVYLTKWWFIRGILQHLIVHEIDNRRVYAYSAKNGGLSFSYRLDNGFSSRHNRMQYVALLLAIFVNIIWPFNRPWLIFEKRSMRAQDAGFAFFEYIKRKQLQQKVYFLLNDASPDWQHAQDYTDSVVKFGSFKHLYLLHRARLYVSSESNGHAYFWRHNTGIVSNLVRIHPSIFLQHGVLGFKKLDKIFKAGSLSAPMLFMTSSKLEQHIVETFLDYPKERVPITGLTRWDAVQPSELSKREVILFFYTWRPWLDDVTTTALIESEYYQHLLKTVTSIELDSWASAHGKELVVVLHPKVAELLPDRQLGHVSILGDADVPLNQLMERVAVLVTDYSSLSWEAYYRDIPVIFDRFDFERYEESVGMYLTDENVPFGQLRNMDIVPNLRQIGQNEFQLSSRDNLNKTQYFAFQDSHNSERVYQAIQTMPNQIWRTWRWQLLKKAWRYLR